MSKILDKDIPYLFVIRIGGSVALKFEQGNIDDVVG